jgi:hypothetical protein
MLGFVSTGSRQKSFGPRDIGGRTRSANPPGRCSPGTRGASKRRVAGGRGHSIELSRPTEVASCRPDGCQGRLAIGVSAWCVASSRSSDGGPGQAPTSRRQTPRAGVVKRHPPQGMARGLGVAPAGSTSVGAIEDGALHGTQMASIAALRSSLRGLELRLEPCERGPSPLLARRAPCVVPACSGPRSVNDHSREGSYR